MKSLPGGDVGAANPPRSRVVAYGACHGVSTSDHAPVYASCEVMIRGAGRDANATVGRDANATVGRDANATVTANGPTRGDDVRSVRVLLRVVLEDADVGGPTRRDGSAAETPRGTNANASAAEGYHVPGTPMCRAASPARRETMMDKLLAARDADARGGETNGDGNGGGIANGIANGMGSAPQALDPLAEALRRLASGAATAAAHFVVAGDASDPPPGAVADVVAARRAPTFGEGANGEEGGMRGMRRGESGGGESGGMRGEEGGGMRGEEGGGMRGGSADHRTIIAGDEDTSRARNQNPVVEISWSPSALPSLETRVGDERAGAGDASASAVAARLERAGLDDDDSRVGDPSDEGTSTAVEASRVASSIARRNVVATVTVDRDAVGSAVIPLAEAAAEAVRVAASSPDADAVSASTAFSVPVTRFGRLCGVAEGELEVTTRGVEDE